MFTLLFTLIAIVSSQSTLDELKHQTTKECTDPTHKHYPLITMGYITPWKKEGYTMLEKYYNKFDIVSPTWFELQLETINNELNIKIDGADNVDMKYLKSLKLKNKNLKVFPRFHCSQTLNINDLIQSFTSSSTTTNFLKILNRRIKANKFDGIVLDCIQLWLENNLYSSFIEHFLPTLSKSLKETNKEIIITLFPYSETNNHNLLNSERFEYLSQYIDYFNIMTYDYIQYHSITNQETQDNKIFNAPLTWIKQSIEYYIDDNNKNKENLYKKILLGLPFHGYTLSKTEQKGDVLDSFKFNHLLTQITEDGLIWNEDQCEHLIDIKEGKSEYVAVYPTNKFLKERLEMTKQFNLGGCAIWDVGNGNEGFMDEF